MLLVSLSSCTSMQVVILLQWIFLIVLVNADAASKNEDKTNIGKDFIKYKYGYIIQDGIDENQGKQEVANGDDTEGRYFIQGKDSSHNVQYFLDNWGLHPLIEYGDISPYSKSQVHYIFSGDAIQALRDNKFSENPIATSKTETSRKNNKILTRKGGARQLNINEESISSPQSTASTNDVMKQTIYVTEPPMFTQSAVQTTMTTESEQHPKMSDEKEMITESTETNSEVTRETPTVQPTPEFMIADAIALPMQAPQVKEQENLVLSQSQAGISRGTAQMQLIINNQADSRLIKEADNDYDDTVLSQQHLGDFGSKIGNPKFTQPVTSKKHYYSVETNPKVLIESTRNLVSGQDVLNINEAVNEPIDMSTISSIVTDYTLMKDAVKVDPIVTTTETPVINLAQDPIIVAEFEDQNGIISNTNDNQVQGEETAKHISAVLVTPKPISANFLAPITAGMHLEDDEMIQEQSPKEDYKNTKENYVVDIQKSLPFYLGKFEFVQQPPDDDNQQSASGVPSGKSSGNNYEKTVFENLELGKTLLSFPQDLPRAIHYQTPKIKTNFYESVSSKHSQNIQQLPEVAIRDNFVEVEQQESQQVNQNIEVNQGKNHVDTNEKPAEIIRQPYPIEVPIHIPYAIERPVPITVTKVVEKKVPVPQPYPVEKVIEKPVHIPIEITRYVERPYPVQVPVAHPIPYPVDRVVEKIVRQPYPVEIRVPYEVPVPVEKIVEKKIPVPVQKIIEKPHYIERPYPIEVPIPVVPHTYVLPPQLLAPIQVNRPTFFKHTPNIQTNYQSHRFAPPGPVNSFVKTKQSPQQPQPQHYTYANYANAYGHNYLPPKFEFVHQPISNYLAAASSQSAAITTNCDQQHTNTKPKHIYYNLKPDDYIGLLPPKHHFIGTAKSLPRKYRNARSNFNTNLRMEYGFMPPLIPSQEIDQHGNPIEKNSQ